MRRSLCYHQCMNHSKVEVRDAACGKGLFALRDIEPDEVVAEITGDEYEAERISDLSQDIADHALQIGPHQWIHADAPGRYLNHSCNPNCGIRGITTIVAMTRIRVGEECRFDYEMSECSDWRMECQCGSPDCRGTIGSYDNMPHAVREKYRGYISQWLEPAE